MDTGRFKKFIWILLYPLNYFFYKIFIFTRDYLTNGDYPMANTSIMALFLILNTFTLYIYAIGTLPSIWVFVIIIIVLWPYSSPKISLWLVDLFSKESDNSKAIGGLLVVAYLILSVILFAKSVIAYQKWNFIE